ncbi:anti-sigma factor family protein [Streptomyces sp. NPDC054945]
MTPPTGMSGTTGTIRHPDVSEISDLTEGLLSPSRTAEIRRHLDDCALCADVRASLEEIRSLLGTLPGPARMPADIAGRIDAALAAEALLDSTQPRVQDVPADRPPRTADRDVSRGTPPATAGRYPRPAGHPTGPTGPGRRRARRRIAVLTGLVAAAACAVGIFLFGDFSGTTTHETATSGQASDSAARPSAAASGEDKYTAQGLQDSVRQLIAGGQGAKNVPEEQNNTLGLENTAPASGDKRGATSVPACVQQATGRPDTPLAAERGSYQGTPVYLLVLPHPADSARVDAYLVDTACEQTGSDDPGKVLLTNTYAR